MMQIIENNSLILNTRNMKLTFFLLTLAVFIGCNSNVDDASLAVPISTTLIASGNLYGNGGENIPMQNMIISNNKEWTELMNKLNSVNNVTDNFTETEFDFSNFTIIALFDDIKMYGGYSIEIESVVENRSDLIAVIRHLSPNGIAPTVITQPYFIVKIPKTEKRIIFKN